MLFIIRFKCSQYIISRIIDLAMIKTVILFFICSFVFVFFRVSNFIGFLYFRKFLSIIILDFSNALDH
jgi:hypothetical protein